MLNLATFTRQIRSRSAVCTAIFNRDCAVNNIEAHSSTLQKELDSLIRVIYLLSIDDRVKRKLHVISITNYASWMSFENKALMLAIGSKDMAQCAGRLHGPAALVFAFAHLSTAYDPSLRDPFQKLTHGKRQDILRYLQGYFGTKLDDDASFDDISSYLPSVFEKVSEDLEWYLKRLENNEDI